MPKTIDRTGERFGKLVVLGLTGKQGNDRKCKVRCDCGVEKEIVQSKLATKTKPVRSCGCLSKENHYRTHGLTSHKFYPIWRSMVGRCYTKSNSAYGNYGGRGIAVCEEWRSNPKAFINWLKLNGYLSGLQVDRIDNNGGYSPENCRVVSAKENSNNRRDTIKYDVFGENLTISQMSEKYGTKYGTLYRRIKIAKLSAESAVSRNLYKRDNS